MTPKKTRDGLLKDGTSRLAKAGNRRGMPRIMWLAIVVCIVGAALLFRGQGGDVPAGIGERRSVVTVGADTAAAPAAAPRSGDVDITTETRAITPEMPSGQAAAATEAATRTETTPPPAETTAPAPAKTTPAKTTPATSTTTAKPAAKPAAPAVTPASEGPWLVQAGSFGQAENADRAAAALRTKGWDARVKVGNTSDGSMIHRVQIGWFATRQDAETFIKQNRKDLAGAIAVHR